MRSGYRLAGTQRALVPLSGPYRDFLGSTHRFVEVSGSGLTNATFATVAIVRTRDDQVRQSFLHFTHGESALAPQGLHDL